MPARPWVDPVKDGTAAERDLRIGRKTWPQLVAEAGWDPEEQLEEIEKRSPRAKAAGLDFGSKAAGKPSPAADDSEDDDDTAQD